MFSPQFLPPTYQLSAEDVQMLVNNRNAYNYPKAYMRISDTPTAYQLTPSIWAEIVHPLPGEFTDLALDQYHTGLLHSDDPVKNLLGTLSVVFWGFYSMGGVAPTRALWHLKNIKSKTAATPQIVHTALQETRAPADLGIAMGKISHISQLGRTPFASKVIAFCRPDDAGVMDNRLSTGLSREAWSHSLNIRRGIGDVSVERYQERYSTWCRFLVLLRNQLNSGIDTKGMDWCWSENNVPQRWRAIDVERAIFQDYAP